MDKLDDLIREIQGSNAKLSAEARNTLHGCLSTHPWGRGKTMQQRVLDLRCAVAGRGVDANVMHRVERLT